MSTPGGVVDVDQIPNFEAQLAVLKAALAQKDKETKRQRDGTKRQR